MFKQTLKTSRQTPDYATLQDEELVFVYGTFMQGYLDNKCLSEGRAKLEGYATTSERFRMINLGTSPALHKYDPDRNAMLDLSMLKRLKEDIEFRPVIGEVYRVKKDSMILLDVLVGNEFRFYREKIKLSMRDPVGNGNPKNVHAWCYILKYPYKYEGVPITRHQDKKYYSWRVYTRKSAA